MFPATMQATKYPAPSNGLQNGKGRAFAEPTTSPKGNRRNEIPMDGAFKDF
jgi:hypothetical protein